MRQGVVECVFGGSSALPAGRSLWSLRGAVVDYVGARVGEQLEQLADLVCVLKGMAKR